MDIKLFTNIQGSTSNSSQFSNEIQTTFQINNLLDEQLIEQFRILYHFIKVAKISQLEAIQLLIDLNTMIYKNTDQEEFQINSKERQLHTDIIDHNDRTTKITQEF